VAKDSIFEKNYRDYLAQISRLDLKALAHPLGIDVLPKVPSLLLFNDKDDEFPAQCSVLFEKRADKFLDMECLAMVGMLLSEYLRKLQR
jgi:hypothetical protein